MHVTVEPITTVEDARIACGSTIGKDSRICLEDLAYCEHSPLRTQEFWVKMVDIPTFVSIHLVRHKIGVEHFVKSNRTDRGGTGKEDRYTPVTHTMKINAQALIFLARKRLCAAASRETREVMWAIKNACPEWLAPYMVAECIYRGGWCHELRSCGFRPKAQVRSADGISGPPL